MRHRGATLFLIALSAAATASSPPPPLPQMEGVMEIRSYGERPRDLLALLVPFLGERHFAPDSRRRVTTRAEGSEYFLGPGGDFISTAGRFNCIVVAYYTTGAVPSYRRASPKERTDAFRLALWDFVNGLPTPRPTLREVSWGSRYCDDAT